MRSVTYVITKPPGAIANETLDIILVRGVMEQPTTVLFLQDGVYQLLQGDSKYRDTATKWSTLQSFDIENVFVDQQSLVDRHIDFRKLPSYVSVVDRAQFRQLLLNNDLIVND